MKRLLPRLLPFVLVAAFGQVQAAPDALACRMPPIAGLDPNAVSQAAIRLDAARAQPGDQQLALAGALSDLALASVRQSGRPLVGSNGNPPPAAPSAELVRQAVAIWNAARPDPALAASVQARGNDFFQAGQCELGRDVLEAALRLSAADVTVVEDLLRVALAMRDDARIRRLAPAVTATLDAGDQPLDARETQVVLALVGYFAMQPDQHQQDFQQAEHLAQRALARMPADMPGTARHTLSWRLASIYYAELRYPEAEALRTRLLAGQPDPTLHKDEFTRQRDELAALVRKGDLKGALSLARAALAQRQQAFYASGQAVGDADFALAQAKLDATTPKATLADLARRSAQAHARENTGRFWLAETRSFLGEILHAMGDLDGAQAAYQQALDEDLAAAPLRWRDRVRTRSDLAILYRTRGEVAKAMTLQQQVLDELLPMVGEDHPDVQQARSELARLHALAGGRQ